MAASEGKAFLSLSKTKYRHFSVPVGFSSLERRQILSENNVGHLLDATSAIHEGYHLTVFECRKTHSHEIWRMYRVDASAHDPGANSYRSKGPFIQADENRRIFLYGIDGESGRSTLVPLSEDEYLQYNSVGGRNVLEKKQSYYDYGRKNRDEDIMGEDIERKTMILKALLNTARKRRNDCAWLLDGAESLDERRSGIEKFKPDVEDSLMNVQKILNSLRQEYLQLCQESGMTSLKEFKTSVQVLETQVTHGKDSWNQLVSESD